MVWAVQYGDPVLLDVFLRQPADGRWISCAMGYVVGVSMSVCVCGRVQCIQLCARTQVRSASVNSVVVAGACADCICLCLPAGLWLAVATFVMVRNYIVPQLH